MRLLLSEEWFEAVSSEGQYEIDFESVILSRANSLFPQFKAVPFKVPVESEDGRKIPDLALVDFSYRFWWVVEVEMAHHSLRGHVIPQVEIFARGKYGEEHADHLSRSRADLDKSALQDMMLGAQPRVAVVVNRNVPHWIEPLHKLDAILTVVELYRSDRNLHILRVNGDYPEVAEPQFATHCRLDSTLRNLLQVDSPAALGVATGEQIQLEFNGGLTTWSRLDSSDKVWLAPTGRNPLSFGQEYVIWREADSRMILGTP